MDKREALDLIAAYDLRPIRSLGQNFLVDEKVLQDSLDALQLSAADTVLEIGPGLGALTARLLETKARVIAIEIDRHLIPLLKDRFGAQSNLTLWHADALKCDFCALIPSQGRFHVAANVPYYITSELLQRLFELPQRPQNLCLLLQKEAVQRFKATPGSKAYGPLAVQIALFGSLQVLRQVSPQAFMPPPAVRSQLILIRRHQDLNPPGAAFASFLQDCFRQRRKTLLNSLLDAGSLPLAAADLKTILNSLFANEGVRPEALTPQDYLRLFQRLQEG